MINEGRGISDINKIETENIFNLLKNNGFKVNNKYNIDGIDIIINFYVGDYYANYHFKNGIHSLNYTFPTNYNEIKVKETITHEINHFMEIKSIMGKNFRYPKYDKIKKSLINFTPTTTVIGYLKHIIYLTLDNEINANVSQTYTYLKQFNTSDINILKIKLNEYDKRKEYMTIKMMKTDKIANDINNNDKSLSELMELNDLLISNGVGDFLILVDFKGK